MGFIVENEKVFESNYLTPGIHKNVKLEGFEADEDRNNIKIKISCEGKTAEDTVVFSENAVKYSIQKLTHIWDRFYPTEEWKTYAATANGIKEISAFLDRKLKGKVFDEFKLCGKEIAGKDGKQNWWKATIGLPSFCSTEFSPKPLKFDKMNQYDWVRLVVADANPVASESNDLLF